MIFLHITSLCWLILFQPYNVLLRLAFVASCDVVRVFSIMCVSQKHIKVEYPALLKRWYARFPTCAAHREPSFNSIKVVYWLREKLFIWCSRIFAHNFHHQRCQKVVTRLQMWNDLVQNLYIEKLLIYSTI